MAAETKAGATVLTSPTRAGAAAMTSAAGAAAAAATSPTSAGADEAACPTRADATEVTVGTRAAAGTVIALSPTLQVGKTVTGEPETDADVENVGSEKAVVLQFTIPRGARGADGASEKITNSDIENMLQEVTLYG